MFADFGKQMIISTEQIPELIKNETGIEILTGC
jgi:hypothetical protein